MNCTQPGCTGVIVDGYCDRCGMAPPRAAPTPEPARSPTPQLPPSSALTLASVGTAQRPTTARTRTGGRGRLGAGLVQIDPVPYRDPADALLEPSAALVPESRRFCAYCDEPVGRGRDGAPGRTAGFCRKCGTPFSFEPKLRPGELVAGQYEVAGCIAHGGMGWVYLARDRNVSDRWVVLKGLLNAGDSDAMAAALAERRFLAEVEHPNIVKIFNFVQHESSGYIVMEYVGGRSLKQILAARRQDNGGEPDPLPPTQAVAYMLEVLPALGYLHQLGLLFCDFKIDNVIQTQHSLKLIDLGGVYRLDDPTSSVFGTTGYQAPEIASAGPSVASDLFTVARTLAVLCLDFRGYQSTYRFTLPPQEDVPLLARYDSLYQFLLTGTAPDPDERFQSAEEMADQLYGVLREIVSDEEGHPAPGPSNQFGGPLRGGHEHPEWRALPHPQVDSDDPAAGYLATITTADPQQTIAQLNAAPERTVEVELRHVAALIGLGDWDEVDETLDAIEASNRWEWRARWYRGLAALAMGRPAEARTNFAAVYHLLPGELAPKLALGMASECDERFAEAAGWYDIVSRTDPAFTAATFGLARCRLESGDRAGALAAYDRVPDSSSAYLEAQTARIHRLTSHEAVTNGTAATDELLTAGAILTSLPIRGGERARLEAELLEAALALVQQGSMSSNGRDSLLGCRLQERDLRLGVERSYRELARWAASSAERIQLVDRANQVRPRTWT
ncbi:MAG TPA: tetratricopeptide repeat protein [Solirubrobacteraceae bacterium]|nr:tetratricopeptide repeat protein [Solirubrobacteraceae bacterium]